MKEELKRLRVFFRISNAAFEFTNSIQLAINGYLNPNKMQELHKIALIEVESENPNFELINKLLYEMENLAEKEKI